MNVLCKYAGLSLAMLVGAYALGSETPNELDREQKAKLYLQNLKQRLKYGLNQSADLVGGAALLGAGPLSSLAHGVFWDAPAGFLFSAARGPAYAATGVGAYLLYRFYNNNVRGVGGVIKARTAPYRAAHQQKSREFRARTPDDVYYNLGSNYSNY